eukprot:12035413-Heterocapsa_arctica.AAC.1
MTAGGREDTSYGLIGQSGSAIRARGSQTVSEARASLIPAGENPDWDYHRLPPHQTGHQHQSSCRA